MKREINLQEINRAEAFDHVQMDGGHASKFLQRLQNEINKLK